MMRDTTPGPGRRPGPIPRRAAPGALPPQRPPGPRHQGSTTPPRRGGAGSASIEFVALVPFVLVMMGLVWDLREYVSHRTELARQMFVAAEVIGSQPCTPTNCPGTTAIESVAERVKERLAPRGAGTIEVAVVVRGATQDPSDPSSDCVDGSDVPEWCLPWVAAKWPPATSPDDRKWNGGGHCDTLATELPDEGQHFDLDAPVLPNETNPATHQDWPSRELTALDWWVVIDTCLHARAGLFGGLFVGGEFRGAEFFDVSQTAFVFQRRAAWGSPNDYFGPSP